MAPFEQALLFTMRYEVGAWFKLDEETLAGKCDTPAQKRKTGYTNDPADKGGETKFGIAKNANPGINIKKMSWGMAKAVYEQKYWKAAKCDQLPGNLAIAVFDAAVHHGPGNAAKFLQRAVGVEDDGVIGPMTLKAVMVAIPKVDVVGKFMDERRKFMTKIPDSKKFINGWLARCDDVTSCLKGVA